MASRQPIRPSVFFYFLSALIALLGVAAFVGIFYWGFHGLSSSMRPFKVPGSVEVPLEGSGTYTIYNEYQSVFRGKAYDTQERLPGLTVTVSSKETGKPIPIKEPTTRNTYSFGGRKGRSLFQFTVPEKGVYTITGSYQEPPGGPEAILSVGKGFFKNLTLMILGGIATLFLAITLSIAMTILTFLKRDKYKRQLKERGLT